MAINNKNQATVGPDGVINAIPTNNSNQIKAVNFHNYFGNLFEWIFPGASAPSGDGSTLVSNGNYELSWDILMPIGGIIPYGGKTAPNGWLLCDGSDYPTATYPELESVLDSEFNNLAFTPPGNFRVPDLKGKTIIGLGQQNRAIPANEFSVPNYTMGDAGGVNQYRLSLSQMPAHNHYIDLTTTTQGDHQHGIPNDRNQTPSSVDYSNDEYGGIFGGATHLTQPSGQHNHDVRGNSNNTGGTSAIENRQSYLVLNYIIKT